MKQELYAKIQRIVEGKEQEPANPPQLLLGSSQGAKGKESHNGAGFNGGEDNGGEGNGGEDEGSGGEGEGNDGASNHGKWIEQCIQYTELVEPLHSGIVRLMCRLG